MWSFKRQLYKTATPPYCCGDIFLAASNYTDEDVGYYYEDCETGNRTFITVRYGSGGITVRGRIPC